MPQPVSIFVRHIPEEVVEGKRLGRHILIDSRSAAYPFRPPRRVVRPQLWERLIPILDQGDLGSCTGNAIVGALGTGPVFGALPVGHPALDEDEAVALYSAATRLDGYPGDYPPDDTGSDGLSACKAAQKAGLLSGYTHADGVTAMGLALQAGPVIAGSNWWSSMDYPDSSGKVSITPGAYVRGGHEYEVRGVDPDRREFFADNSWGAGYADKGSFRIPYDVMDRLQGESGDCTVPVPVTQPAPVPVPVPTPPGPVAPNDPDLALWQQTRDWAHARHAGCNRRAAQAVLAWAEQLGLS